jgi:hypothetical protein
VQTIAHILNRYFRIAHNLIQKYIHNSNNITRTMQTTTLFVRVQPSFILAHSFIHFFFSSSGPLQSHTSRTNFKQVELVWSSLLYYDWYSLIFDTAKHNLVVVAYIHFAFGNTTICMYQKKYMLSPSPYEIRTHNALASRRCARNLSK